MRYDVDFTVLNAIQDPTEHYAKARELLSLCHYNTSERINELLQASNTSPRQLALDAGVDYPLLTKKLKAGFTIRMNRMSAVAYSHLINLSCNELYLGFDRPTVLPLLTSVLTRQIAHADASVRARMLQAAEKAFEDAKQGCRLAEDGTDLSQLTNERLREAAEDRYCKVRHLCGENADFTLRSALYKVETEEREKMRTTKREKVPMTVSLDVVSYTALCLGTTLDYFGTVDYTRHTKLCYFDSGEIMEDGDLIRFVSMFTRLGREDRGVLAAEILREQIRSL